MIEKLNMVNKRLHEKAHKHVKCAIDEIMAESLPSIASPHQPQLPQLDIDDMMKSENDDQKKVLLKSYFQNLLFHQNEPKSSATAPAAKATTSKLSILPRKRTRNSKRKNTSLSDGGSLC